MAEILPGLHQIEQKLGSRYLFQYLLIGEHSMLIDTGLATSPDKYILPYFQKIGFEPGSLNYIIISHADADHFGGNARMRQAAPQAILTCHNIDAPWIGSREQILKERYGWYEQFELSYPPEATQWLNEAMGPDARIDLQLTGQEMFMLGGDRPIHMLYLPGHTDGHIGLYDQANQAIIIIDAVQWKGTVDVEGNIISPPSYSRVHGYLETIDLLLELDFEHLFLGHHPHKSGQEARRFLEESKDYVHRCWYAVADTLKTSGRPMTLADVYHQVNRKMGPYPVMPIELAEAVYAHLDNLTREGLASCDQGGDQPTWQTRSD